LRSECANTRRRECGRNERLADRLKRAAARKDGRIDLADEDFAEEDSHVAVPMQAGDAVLYQGVHRHHGRTTPNPNRWSAHLFLHWVARNGPYANQAFDGRPPPEAVEFELG